MKKIKLKFNIFWSLTLLFTMLFFAIGGYMLGFWGNNPKMQVANYFVDETNDYVRNFDLVDSSSKINAGRVSVTRFNGEYFADFDFQAAAPSSGFKYYAFAGDKGSMHNLGVLQQANGLNNYRLSAKIPVSVNNYEDLDMAVYLISEDGQVEPQKLAFAR